jgi:hypothetical protein
MTAKPRPKFTPYASSHRAIIVDEKVLGLLPDRKAL